MLTERGYIKGFGDEASFAFTRNHQMAARDSEDRAETPSDGQRQPHAGMMSLDELAPEPIRAGEPGYGVAGSRSTGREQTPGTSGRARTGGAGKTASKR